MNSSSRFFLSPLWRSRTASRAAVTSFSSAMRSVTIASLAAYSAMTPVSMPPSSSIFFISASSLLCLHSRPITVTSATLEAGYIPTTCLEARELAAHGWQGLLGSVELPELASCYSLL